jgi:peptide/nickel transport system permease protein
MSLKRYIARRAAYTVVLIFVIIIFNFILFQILPFTTSCSGLSYNECVISLYVPPPPARAGTNITLQYQHEVTLLFNQYGFNRPLQDRFFLYIESMFTWQFGYNIGAAISGPVQTTIVQRLPYTLLLIGLSTIASFVVGIGMGVVSAARRGRVVDVASLASTLFFFSLPTFWLGGLLIVLQILLGGGGYESVGLSTAGLTGLDATVATLVSLWLPFLTLTLVSIGGVFLTMRATMIDVLAEDYIVMARAKGIQERAVLFRHALRNAIIPIITLFAIDLGFILAGAVITETVFDWPGLGRAIFIGITSNDFPLEQAIFYIISLMVLLANFAVDVMYGYLDPRIKTG